MGRIKGCIPWNKDKSGLQVAWNKGLTKKTDERVLKYSISGKKTKHSENWKIKRKNNHTSLGKKFSKELYPNYGMRNKKHTKETKRKISINNGKGMLGKSPSLETVKKIITSRKKSGWFKDLEKTREKMKKNKRTDKFKQNLKDFWNKPENKSFIKERRKKQITPIKDSSIELKIQDFLSQLHIEFFIHKYMNIEHGYQCDIFIPSKNLIIECDGDYWHNYPIGREIDKIRTKELIEQGFKVIRIWESEIKKMNMEDLKNKIKNAN